MKNPKAAEIIRLRLKYDWIVLLYGILCILIQFIYKGNWEVFLILVMYFVIVEISIVSTHRKLKNGGEGYHALVSSTLDQDTSTGMVMVAVFFEFVFLLTASWIFFANGFK
jgi:hypothetical protein